MVDPVIKKSSLHNDEIEQYSFDADKDSDALYNMSKEEYKKVKEKLKSIITPLSEEDAMKAILNNKDKIQ